ncbi:MAG TPA: hypothetical protein DDX39_02690 [Bacteroidales bacterium]|nr:MAG: hypothetical protein A2W98_03705 [Bacteroidetes bacterium GWF2_33_38]OFY76693.1 MAG: hypothetical protein A2265_08150 [Bacteroidetes bacterium RIFOXYA12_FULL_33_9]OFY84866.1 MAG: hypothetical protein A2236_09350 [Bacteroidetes bacterium RIFOXYA2_FULL_33_7]HBF87524.1 hypothetical protein [Bacteroidales bacterium]
MKLYPIIVCFLFFSTTVFSQKNIELFIEYSDSSIVKHGGKKVFFLDSLKLNSYLDNFIVEQKAEGYLTSSIDQISIDSTKATVQLFTGNKYTWKNIYTDSIEQVFLKKNGIQLSRYNNKFFEQNSFYNLMNKIVGVYENNGYPFTKIQLNKTTFYDNKISTFIDIKKDNLYRIDSVNAIGNAKISSSILYHLIDIHPHDIYNETKIREIDKKIKNVPYLRLAKSVEVFYSDDEAKILLELEKQKANQFNGIIGFIPNANLSNKLLLTGDLKLLIYNQLTLGEKLDFNWQKIDQYSQKVDAGVNVPYFFNIPIGFAGNLNLNKKDTSYLNVNANLAVLFHVSTNSSIDIFYQNKSSNVLSDYVQNISNVSTSLFGFGLSIQNLDYIYNPSNGVEVNMKIGAGNKKGDSELLTEKQQTQIESVSEIQFYKTIVGNLIFRVRNQSAFIKLYNETNYNFYENEAFRVGGLKSLRGFDEEAIFATSYSIFTTELRYLFEENSAIYLFSDGGYVEKNLISGFESDMPIGIGAGIDFETKAGIFTLNYALGKQLGNPFSIRSAKIHLGFISRF